jgi:hypothetical protein
MHGRRASRQTDCTVARMRDQGLRFSVSVAVWAGRCMLRDKVTAEATIDENGTQGRSWGGTLRVRCNKIALRACSWTRNNEREAGDAH